MNEEVSKEAKTFCTILKHNALVAFYLHALAHRLEERAVIHDLSKFSDDEFHGFVRINQIAREHEYGSEEYQQAIRDTGVVPLHYSRNPHHPEHHPNQVMDMNLINMVEMVVDWKVASEVYGNTQFEDALEIQRERFKLTDEQMYLISLVTEALNEI